MGDSKLSSESEEDMKKGQANTAPEVENSDDFTEVDDSEKTGLNEEPADDKATDVAVDDIMKEDSDKVLEAQDEATQKGVIVSPTTRWGRFKNVVAEWWSKPRNRWIVVCVVVVLLGVTYLVPIARSNVAGLIFKAPVTVQVLDSKTNKAVSGASVTLAGKTVKTDATGKAKLSVHAGSKTLKITKKYYASTSKGELVKLWAGTNSYQASLLPLGRQVSIRVVNKITGKPVAGATIKAGKADAKTDKKGQATLVISSDATTQAVTVTLTGYNDLKGVVTAGGTDAQNTFSVIPAGKLYFLSNLSGKIDVIKTNLDGTDRQTVLAGTGNEDRYSTSLLASRDWKYLVLLSKRSGDNASVYLIDTTNGDKLTTIDEGNATFSLVGWSGDRFVYQVNRYNQQIWQTSRQALKSFDPASGQTTLLAQTQATGTNSYDYVAQQITSVYLQDDQVVYSQGWSAGNNSYSQIPSKAATLETVGADGSGHRVVKSFSLSSSGPQYQVYITTALYAPNGLYVEFNDASTSKYYEYEDGKVADAPDMTSDKFNSIVYPTYLASPSGNSTFWGDQRDGKNTLFTGDKDSKNAKQIASLSDYKAYGWYTDNYLLVSKNSSELYVMSTTGGTPFKITDYYKPAINYSGYGGGYGGL